MCREYQIATGEGAALSPKSSEQTSMEYAEAVGFVKGLRALSRIQLAEESESNE